MNRAPRLSALMAVRNAEAHLNEAIESILLQSFEDFELVIIDDGSTDGTPEILRRYSQLDQRVRTERIDSVGSLPAALNFGLGLCRGELIARMDGDDVALPERFERQVIEMERDPSLGLLGCSSIDIDEGGETIGRTYHPVSHEAIKLLLPFRSCFIHPSVVIRRQAIEAVGGYDETFWTGQDYELWSRLIKVCRVANLDAPLLKRRVHPRSITASAERNRVHDTLLAPVRQRMASDLLGISLTQRETETLRHAVQSDGIADVYDVLNIIKYIVRYGRTIESQLPPYEANLMRRAIASSLLSQVVFNRRGQDVLAKISICKFAVKFHRPVLVSRGFILAIISLIISSAYYILPRRD